MFFFVTFIYIYKSRLVPNKPFTKNEDYCLIENAYLMKKLESQFLIIKREEIDPEVICKMFESFLSAEY